MVATSRPFSLRTTVAASSAVSPRSPSFASWRKAQPRPAGIIRGCCTVSSFFRSGSDSTSYTSSPIGGSASRRASRLVKKSAGLPLYPAGTGSTNGGITLSRLRRERTFLSRSKGAKMNSWSRTGLPVFLSRRGLPVLGSFRTPTSRLAWTHSSLPSHLAERSCQSPGSRWARAAPFRTSYSQSTCSFGSRSCVTTATVLPSGE